MGKKVIRLKESDIVKLVKSIISEEKKQPVFNVEFKIGKETIRTTCQFISVHCKNDQNYVETRVKINDYWSKPVPEFREEVWRSTFELLKGGIVNEKYNILSPELAKYILSICQNNNQGSGDTELLNLVAFKCLKPGTIQITVGKCGTTTKGCYKFIYPKGQVSLSESVIGLGVLNAGQETWTIDCESLKKNIVYLNQGFKALCPELAKYLLYKAECCGGQGGGGEQGECTTIRCKIESEVNKCTKKKYSWKEVKDAFEIEFPSGAPKGSAERNRQLWKEWKGGWRPKCGETPNPETDQDQYAF